MSISTITQPAFMVSIVSEMDITWPDGSFVFCQSNNCIYQLKSGAFTILNGNYLVKSYSVTTTSGSKVIYLTDNGLIGGNPLFSTVDYVHIDFVSNDPNFGKSYILSGVTLTISAVKQTFTGITLLATNILGSVTIPAAANGTALTVLVQGTPV